MKARNRVFLLLGVMLLIALGIYYFTTNHSTALELVGTVDAKEVVVSSRVQGQIESLNVDEGQRVTAGQLVATIASQDLAYARKAAEATAQSDQYKLEQARMTALQTEKNTESQVASAEAQVRVATAQLAQAIAVYERQESDTRRAVALANAGVNTEQTRDEMVKTLHADRAAMQSARDSVAAQEAALRTAQANLLQAKAALATVGSTRADVRSAQALANQANVQLGYARIVSPVTGVVDVRAALQGEVVAPTTPIVTIVDLSQTWVYAPLPETYADAVKLGDKLRVVMPSGGTVWGTVIAKAALAAFATQRDVSRRKRDIRTVQLKLLIPNPGMKYVPGMTANVYIPESKLVQK